MDADRGITTSLDAQSAIQAVVINDRHATDRFQESFVRTVFDTNHAAAAGRIVDLDWHFLRLQVQSV
jgi:hypothetical protein